MAGTAGYPQYNGFEIDTPDEGETFNIRVHFITPTSEGPVRDHGEYTVLASDIEADPNAVALQFLGVYDDVKSRLDSAGFTVPTESTGVRHGFDTVTP